MPRLILLCVLGACLMTPAMAQRNRERPPELPFIQPDPITIDQVPDALDELVITFDRAYNLGVELTESEKYTEFYLARQDDPENQREVLVWVVESVQSPEFVQIDRFQCDDAWRYRLLRRTLDDDQGAVASQMDYMMRHGPIWTITAKQRLQRDLPGAEVYYCATQVDDTNTGTEYRIFFDARHDGELKRIVYASKNNEAVIEYLGPAPRNYRVDPFDTKNPVVMDPEDDIRPDDADADAENPGDR